MIEAPIPQNERDRLCSVHQLSILDTPNEKRFDDLTEKARVRFKVPISTISIIDTEREWYKSVQGSDLKEAPRNTSFCGHALNSEVMMVVEDTTKDIRFSDNPSVISPPKIRFYAGKSLYNRKTGLAVGVFCIKDIKPRKMELADINDFLELATKAEDELNVGK